MTDTVLRGAEKLDRWLRALTREPRASALFCDIDGTIAPLAPTPAEAAVPEPVRAALASLAPRLGLLAFVTGREVHDGRRMIPLEGAVYVGNHGLQVLLPAGELAVAPTALPFVPAVQTAAVRAALLEEAVPGVVAENKELTVDVHYRCVADPEAVRRRIEREVVAPSVADGLDVAEGKFAVELRPPVAVSKGSVVRDLLEAGACAAALFVGDDLTDVSALEAVAEWAAADPGGRRACAAAVAGGETPAAVTAAADVWLDGTDGVLALLDRLEQATRGATSR